MDLGTYLPFVIGWTVIVIFVVGVILELRRTKSKPVPRSVRSPRQNPAVSPNPDTYPFIWGSPLYVRSYQHRDVAPPARIAMGLPPYHNENAWLKVPGRYRVPL